MESDFESRQLSEYLTIQEAADYLGVSTSTLRNWDKSGKLKAARNPFNGYRIYIQKDLESILKEVASHSYDASNIE